MTTRARILVPALLAAFTLPLAAAERRPNILYIMSDDHAAHAISAYGGRLAKVAPTPTLDRLAKEGMLFSNCYVTNSICTPSRACVMTGQYPHVHGVRDLRGNIPPARQFLAHEMKKAGYHTAMIGKWHLKVEPAAFDYYCVLPGQGKYHGPIFRTQGDKAWPKNTISFPEKHSTDAITDLTLDWLKEGWDKEKPFFLMHHYKAPHDYFEHAKRYHKYLADVEIPEPKSLWTRPGKWGSIATRGANDELLPHIGTSIGNRNPRRSYASDLPRLFPQDYPKDYDPSKLSGAQIKRLAYNVYLRKFLRCVKGIDDNLARLFAHLEATGQIDNTLIIYTGDQGFMLGEHDLQDKRWMFDPSQRMPLLVRYPKTIPAGVRSDALIENVDFAPTMLAFAGVKTPKYMQGRNFLSILQSGQEPSDWRKAAYYRYWMHMAHHDNPAHFGIRTKKHKLIFYYGLPEKEGSLQFDGQTPPGWELYDLEKDPHETVNVYDDPAYAPTVKTLKAMLQAKRKEVGDLDQGTPHIQKLVAEFWDFDEADRKKSAAISGQFLKRRLATLENRKKK